MSAGPGVGAVLRFEVVRLVAQWRVRGLVALCWLGPVPAVAVLAAQSQLPTDTVFGRWLHASGLAAPLVVLGFAGSWALPLLAGLVAGDLVAVEDRLGTWRHLVVTVGSVRRIVAAKVILGAATLAVLVAGLAGSSTLAGLLIVGRQPLVGLDGATIPADRALLLVALAWAAALAPVLALGALGLLASACLGRNPLGLVLPVLVALGLQVVQVLPLPVAVRMALPGQALIAWRGLFTTPQETGPLLVGVLVALGWAAAATLAAVAVLVRRDLAELAPDGSVRRLAVAATPLLVPVLATVLAVGVLAPATARTSGIDRPEVEASLATTFAGLYRLQAHDLRRPDVTEQQLAARASCDRGGPRVADAGPGHDWRCVVTWHLPGTDAVGQAVYQLDLTADGRYVADGDGPKAVNGYFQVRTPQGDAPNPLWQFDGTVDLLGTSPRAGSTGPGVSEPERTLQHAHLADRPSA